MKKLCTTAALTIMLMPLGSTPALSGTMNLSDSPLYITGRVDPNVLINLSIESPMVGAAYNDQNDTANGGSCTGRAAHQDGFAIGTCYLKTKKYIGYFDSSKCYVYSSNQFEPSGPTLANYECSGQWSGNFLNWATMTAIDEFRWALTGGHRSTDTATTTVLERANQTLTKGHNWFPLKKIGSSVGPGSVAPSTVTPYSTSELYIYNHGTQFDVGSTTATSDNVNLNVRVKVCDATVGVEANCQSYGANKKPVGLIQKNAEKMRFAVTSYLNDNNQSRDGGVLRSKMKYTGPQTYASGVAAANAATEWDSATGVFNGNPDSADATASGVSKSGVINYINQFGSNGYKSYDPAGELFYEAIRYFKNLGRTPEYSQTGGAELAPNAVEMDGFPVVTAWDDPILYRCQKNFIVGINDANPWLDKKLPGTFFSSSTLVGDGGTTYNLIGGDYGEPSNPDTAINVTTLTNRVGDLEGLTGTSKCVGGGVNTYNASATNKSISGLGEVMGTCPYPPKQNSYYIAGLAYYANTRDLRSDLSGIQSIGTFMIDTQEYSVTPLTGNMNMLWLAGKYGGFIDKNNNQIPDSAAEWDTNGDGVPDNYVLASQPEKLVTGLENAFADIAARTGASSSIAANSTSLTSTSFIYQARFLTGEWYGELLAFPISTAGVIGSVAWNAGAKLANPVAANRVIVTYKPSTKDGAAFVWADLDTAQQNLLSGSDGATVGEARLNYIRGSSANEGTGSGSFRPRPTSKLGDIVNSSPQYVGMPIGQYDDELFLRVAYMKPSYGAFRTAQAARTPVVYVGANDGMLHGFNATNSTSGGEEVLAYVPNEVYVNLASLTSQSYSHKYFVDGTPVVADAEINGAWKTVLLGGLNGGGKSIYALDVTDPTLFTQANASTLVLWEFSDTDLGYTFGKPMIVKTNSAGKWAAIFGNGYNNTGSGNAFLYILFIQEGIDGTWNTNDWVKLDTKAGSATTPNGIAGINAIDIDGNGTVDAVYGGDLLGNMWKFDLSNTNKNNWKVAYGTTASPAPLYVAKDDASPAKTQPITNRPELSFNPTNLDTVMVYFGTGKYVETTDPANTQKQTFYAIWDKGAPVPSVTTRDSSTLVQQTFSTQTISGNEYRIPSNNAIDWTTHLGWYQDLPTSRERHVGSPRLYRGVLVYDTFIPTTDVCDYGGTGYLMAVDATNGGLFSTAVFDTNGDGTVDLTDTRVGGVSGDATIGGTTVLETEGSNKGWTLGNTTGGQIKKGALSGVGLKGTRISWEELLND